MLEIAPGVYTSPTMTNGVRDRVWHVLSDWHSEMRQGSAVMTWRDPKAPGRQGLLSLGLPPRDLRDYQGLLLAKRENAPPNDNLGSLTK
nr:type I-E CRISPR-associated endoribonuclease Cas2e [Rhodovastum atsumiense]